MAPQGLKTEFWSSENWAYNVQSVRNHFNFCIYTLFLDHDSVLIVQNTRRRKVIKQRVRP